MPQAWKLPVHVAYSLWFSKSGYQNHLYLKMKALEREAMLPAAIKLGLAAFTGNVAYWCLFRLQLGSHSAVGWLAAAVGGVLWLLWWVVSWVWRMALWDPSYLLQVSSCEESCTPWTLTPLVGTF